MTCAADRLPRAGVLVISRGCILTAHADLPFIKSLSSVYSGVVRPIRKKRIFSVGPHLCFCLWPLGYIMWRSYDFVLGGYTYNLLDKHRVGGFDSHPHPLTVLLLNIILYTVKFVLVCFAPP